MTFPSHSQMYPGQPYPGREPPPQIPKQHTFWIVLVLLGTLVLLVAGFVVAFWRAADVPAPVIETPDLQPPPPAYPPTPE